jgi:hypothetical protein
MPAQSREEVERHRAKRERERASEQSVEREIERERVRERECVGERQLKPNFLLNT